MIAEYVLKEGAKVSIIDMNQDALDEMKKYVQETIDNFGSVDVFINNTGIKGKIAPIVEQSVEDFNKVLTVTLKECSQG